MSTYSPTSGVWGSFSIGGHVLNVDSYGQHGECNVMEAPSFPGMNVGFMEHCTGGKKTQFFASGTWNASFNPFSAGIKLGTVQPVIMQVIGVDISGDNDAIVASFDTTNFADGKAEYSILLIGDFIFSDLSGGAA